MSYLVGKWYGCMKFTASDGSESPKYGDKYQIINSYQLMQGTSLASATVLYVDTVLVGLRFAYRDKTADLVSGAGYENQNGPLRSAEFDLAEGESIVGVTFDEGSGYPRRIGFTIMRT